VIIRGAREEGLDERGEAPPPYVPGSKPPSIRSADGVPAAQNAAHVEGEGVELGDMSRILAPQPPDYNENVEADANLRRPETAITPIE